MCSTFSLLVIEWKLCAHTTSNLQTSKLAQCYTILACCWYQWCEYCRFVIFQLFFLKDLCKAQKAMFTSVFMSFDVFYFLSFGYRVETVHTHCKRPTNINFHTLLCCCTCMFPQFYQMHTHRWPIGRTSGDQKSPRHQNPKAVHCAT